MALDLDEYRCLKCGHVFGVLDQEISCPRCGSREVERIILLFATLDHEPTPEDYFAIRPHSAC